MSATLVTSRRRDAVDARMLGRTDYETTWRAMQAFTDARN